MWSVILLLARKKRVHADEEELEDDVDHVLQLAEHPPVAKKREYGSIVINGAVQQINIVASIDSLSSLLKKISKN